MPHLPLTWKDVVKHPSGQFIIAKAIDDWETQKCFASDKCASYASSCHQIYRAVNIIEDCLALFTPPITNDYFAIGYWLIHNSPLTDKEREEVRQFLFEWGYY